MSDYTIKNVADLPDSAPDFGFGELGEARFGRESVDAEDTGFAFHRLKPGKRQGFGHRHHQAEEVVFVAEGSGRMKADDDVVDLSLQDVVRLSPGVTRAFEAGPDGMAILVFGPHHAKDGEMDQGFWPSDG